MHIAAGVVIYRRALGGKAGAARPDLVKAAILPSAQPPEPIPVACARIWKDFQRRCASVAFGHRLPVWRSSTLC